jgi:hypothetical protein
MNLFELPRSMTDYEAFEATSRKMFHDRSTFAPSLRHNAEHHREPRVLQSALHAPRKHVLHDYFYHGEGRGGLQPFRDSRSAPPPRAAATRPRTTKAGNK